MNHFGMRISVIYLGVILMTLNLFSCSTAQKQEQLKVEWRPGYNGPKYYPVEVVSGAFSAGGEVCGIGTGSRQNTGWGYSGMEMSTGNFVPDHLTIGWYSFAEDKFYKGRFDLPADTMRALFKQGYHYPNGIFCTYDNLFVNMYPEGGVALWMKISGDRIVEIGHFQGVEMEYDGNSLYPSMTMDWSDFAKEVMNGIEGGAEYLAKHGVSPEPFKTVYRQRYNYTIEIDNVTHAKTESVLVDFYNGEMDIMRGDGLVDNFFKTKAVPKYISINWEQNGVVYFSKFYSPEEEIFKAFADMSTARPNEPYVLLLKPDYSRRSLTVSLRSQPDANGDIYEIEIIRVRTI